MFQLINVHIASKNVSKTNLPAGLLVFIQPINSRTFICLRLEHTKRFFLIVFYHFETSDSSLCQFDCGVFHRTEGITCIVATDQQNRVWSIIFDVHLISCFVKQLT